MSAQLSLRGLTRRYRPNDPPVLDHLDLDVAPQGCVAILGPSGSGKTTTMRLIAGLDTPSAGDVLLDGISMQGVAPERRGVAMVFQRPLLFPHLSVLDNVAFAAHVTGTPRRKARADALQFLSLVQLKGFGNRSVRELSGGQEQRVALARALAARPRVLLLDEPFSSLDTPLRADMHELLIELRAILKPTILLVTHDQAEAAYLADSIAVLAQGRLLQHDIAQRIYTRPSSLTVSRIMGGQNEVPGWIRDGQHHSAIGVLPLPADIVVRDGPAVLLIRQESLQVTGEGDVDVDVSGTIVHMRAVGARRSVTIEVDRPEGTRCGSTVAHLKAELAPGRPIEVGQRVGIRMPTGALSTVAPQHAISYRPNPA